MTFKPAITIPHCERPSRSEHAGWYIVDLPFHGPHLAEIRFDPGAHPTYAGALGGARLEDVPSNARWWGPLVLGREEHRCETCKYRNKPNEYPCDECDFITRPKWEKG